MRGNFEFRAVAPHPRGPRRLLDQPSQRAPRVRESPRFQDLAQERDEDDLRRDERLAQDQRRQARLRQGKVGADPAMHKRLKRAIDDVRGSQNAATSVSERPSGSRRLSQPEQTEQDVAADQRAQERREGEERALDGRRTSPPADRGDGVAVEMMQIFWSIFTMHLLDRGIQGDSNRSWNRQGRITLSESGIV